MLRSEAAPPRVLIDVNLWISYLLPSDATDRPIDALLDAIIDGAVALIISDELINEIERTVVRKPYLARRIRPEDVADLLRLLRAIGGRVPSQLSLNAPLSRDPKDDYLLAAAIEGDVDILVTGDADLLALRDHLDRPRILTARELIAELGTG